MALIDNWRGVLWRAWTTRLATLSGLCNLIAVSILFVWADELGDALYTALVIGFFVLGQILVWMIPPARIVRQKKLHDAGE